MALRLGSSNPLGPAVFFALVPCACNSRDGEATQSRCESDRNIGRSELALYGATPACESLEAFQQAVGYLLISDINSSDEEIGICSVARVARGVAITAKHCFRDREDFAAVVGFMPAIADPTGCGNGSGESSVLGVLFHPSLDLAMIGFSENGDYPYFRATSSRSDVGTVVHLAGFGLTEGSTIGERRCLESQLTHVGALLVTHSSSDKEGACVGDSGGPLLRGSSNAGFELLGVLSEGSATCMGDDRYVSLLPAKGWVDRAIAQSKTSWTTQP